MINRHGQGNCQGNPSNVFRGKKICYVNQPTTCPDAKESRGSNPGEKFSARACYTATGENIFIEKHNWIYIYF